MSIQTELLKKIEKDKKENEKIKKWLKERDSKEIFILAFNIVKLLLNKGESFENIEKGFKISKLAAQKAREVLRK